MLDNKQLGQLRLSLHKLNEVEIGLLAMHVGFSSSWVQTMKLRKDDMITEIIEYLTER